MFLRNICAMRWISILFFFLIASCTRNNISLPTQVEPAQMIFSGSKGKIQLTVEIARTPQERNLGLMYRKQLPPKAGMLFLFEKEEVQSFWMQNTYIPLDMIFINSKMQVVGIVQSAEPQTTKSRQVSTPSKYVLEVNAGFAEAHGIFVGTKVYFKNIKI